MENGIGLEITELRLGLPGVNKKEKKRMFSVMDGGEGGRAGGTEDDDDDDDDDDDEDDDGKCETNKNQVVGWPPVCAYRRKNRFSTEKESRMCKTYVKISMDGAPFLRKLDLSMHNAYFDLALSLEKLFGCFGIGEALRDGDSCDYVPIYEDKDGDWMLVGDVPWEMFTESCKRLRIMKKLEAKGFELQPEEGKGVLIKGRPSKPGKSRIRS